MYDFNIPEEVINQISINHPVCKYDNQTYILVPTGVSNVYEILIREDKWLRICTDYINYKTCEHTNHYLKDGRIFTRNDIKNAIEELRRLVINDLIIEAKKLNNKISTENKLHNKNDLVEKTTYCEQYQSFEETKYDYITSKTKSLDEALIKYINNQIFNPKKYYYSTDYESAIVNIALSWLSNQISTSTTINQFYDLNTLVQFNENNQELIEQSRLSLIEGVKIILSVYKDVDTKMKKQQNLYQYLFNNHIKTVNVKVDNQDYKINTPDIIRLLRGIEVPLDSTIINFDDIETITYRNKMIYQK